MEVDSAAITSNSMTGDAREAPSPAIMPKSEVAYLILYRLATVMMGFGIFTIFASWNTISCILVVCQATNLRKLSSRVCQRSALKREECDHGCQCDNEDNCDCGGDVERTIHGLATAAIVFAVLEFCAGFACAVIAIVIGNISESQLLVPCVEAVSCCSPSSYSSGYSYSYRSSYFLLHLYNTRLGLYSWATWYGGANAVVSWLNVCWSVLSKQILFELARIRQDVELQAAHATLVTRN
jgi:hypothetical protein